MTQWLLRLVRLTAKQSMMLCAGRASPLPDAAAAESVASEAASDAASEAAAANVQAASLDGVSMAATTASSEAGRAPSQADGSVAGEVGGGDAAAPHAATEAADHDEASVVALGTTASESSSLNSQAKRAWRAALLGDDEPDFESDSGESLDSSTPSSVNTESDSSRGRSESSKAGAISMYDAESQLGGSFMAAAVPEAAALLSEDGAPAPATPCATNAAAQQTGTGKCSG